MACLNGMIKLDKDYFQVDVLHLAPDLLGKVLVRQFADGALARWRITETEAYRGEEDGACHARKGRTPRTEVMYEEGGRIYVYLIYGIYWLLNIVSGPKDDPQAVLIRGLEEIKGPGKVGQLLKLDKSFYGEVISDSSRLWFEDGEAPLKILTEPRVGIDYASEQWRVKPWRFIADK